MPDVLSVNNDTFPLVIWVFVVDVAGARSRQVGGEYHIAFDVDAADNAVHIANGHALPQLNSRLNERIRGFVGFVNVPVQSRQQIVSNGL